MRTRVNGAVVPARADAGRKACDLIPVPPWIAVAARAAAARPPPAPPLTQFA